jgi:type IV pilus assembly protein PilY1
MRRKPEKIIRAVSLIMLGMLSMVFAAGSAVADDTDVYQAMVKNNTLLLMDLSGSMKLAVYDPNIDYTAFLNWAEDPDATDPAQTEICVWQKWNSSGQCYYNHYKVVPHRITPSSFSPIPEGEQEPGYPNLSNMKWEKDKIYLVSADVGYREIVDEDGNITSMTGDYLFYGYNYDASPPTATINVRLITYGVIDTGWEITDWNDPINGNDIDVTVDGDGKRWVVYPDFGSLSDPVMGKSTSWHNSVDLTGERFRNYADMQITNTVTDYATGITRDMGFLGFLRSPGIVFSGLLRTTFNGDHSITADPAAAYGASGDDHVVYAFVTGNYLSFITLVNGLTGKDGGPCGEYDDTWSSRGWRSICYQPVEKFSVSGLAIRSHGTNHKTDDDYVTIAQGINGPGYKEKTPIQPPGFIWKIRFQFEFLDTDACGDDPDYVEFQKPDGTVLLRIKGQNLGPGAEGTIAYAGYQVGDQGSTWSPGNYIDNTTGWTPWLDDVNVDGIRVFFFNGTDNYCDNGDGDDTTRGFNIIGYEYISTGTDNPEITCCNGPDGMGYKIQSRLDIAKVAMAQVVDATKDKLNWGLAVYPAGGSGELRTDFGEDPEAVIADLLAMEAGGSTPTGEALQLGYNFIDTYLESDAEAAACANNYILLMTDGYPNQDDNWNLVDTNDGGNPNFTDNKYKDNDEWSWYWNEGGAEHADDVASWMAGWKNAQPIAAEGVGPDYNVTTHAIGFNFDNPLLADIADDGSGLCITAHNRNELIEAFYTLGLAMTSTTSFIAPVVSVDEANRTQSGDEIYMALFRPVEDDHWEGNLKKFGLAWKTRTDCGRTEGEWTVVDKNGNTATDCDGTILDSAISYWSSSADGITVNKGGVGGLLRNGINNINLATGPHYDFRYIYTYKDNALVPFTYTNINNESFLEYENLSLDENDPALKKIVNFVYGYTYDANGDGTPVAKRRWVLGDIIHSEPEIIEYYDPVDGLVRRLVAVGANDGMLHVFVDHDDLSTLAEGSELFAFVPPDLIDDLQLFGDTGHFYMVDGSPNLWQGSVVEKNSNGIWDTGEYRKKILVFGERRGGRNYWALDVTDPDPGNWSVAWRIRGGESPFEAMGQTWNKPQFAKIRTSSTTFTDVCIFAGGYDPIEDNYPEPFDDSLVNPDGSCCGTGDTWEANNSAYDKNLNGQYDIHNLAGSDDMGRGIYVVDVTDGSVVFGKDGSDKGYKEMKWCLAADPTVISLSTSKLLIYAPDIYGQIWRVSYTYTDKGKWEAYRIFAANPGSDMQTGDPAYFPGSEDSTDTGRKMFYGPDVSYGGNCWTGSPVLYFGTGDREHPNHSMVSNRFYAVKDAFGKDEVTGETDLLNLTCNELEDWTVPDLDGDGSSDQDDVDIQNELKNLLYTGGARGWYRILDEQGDCVVGADDHTGEKMLCQPSLYFKNLYFTTYQPVYDDPCAAGGNTRIYAFDYCWGSSVFDLYAGNNIGDDDIRDIRDTYHEITSTTIASGVRVVTRGGEAAGVISVSGAVSGVGEGLSTRIPSPPGGLTRMLWETD